MSVKIFNGYVYETSSFSKVDALLEVFRMAIGELSKELIIKRAAAMTIGYHDFLYLSEEDQKLFATTADRIDAGNNKKYSLYHLIWKEMFDRETEIQTQKIKDPTYDFSCEVVFFNLGQKFLFLLYSQQQEYKKLFESLEGVQEYCYWNNTDWPEGMTKEEWARRSYDWEIALSRTGTPSLDGYSAKAYGGLPIFSMEEVIEAIKNNYSLEKRVANYAFKVVYAQQRAVRDRVRLSHFSHSQLMEHMRSDECQALIEEKKKELRERFSSAIGKSDISSPVKSLV